MSLVNSFPILDVDWRSSKVAVVEFISFTMIVIRQTTSFLAEDKHAVKADDFPLLLELVLSLGFNFRLAHYHVCKKFLVKIALVVAIVLEKVLSLFELEAIFRCHPFKHFKVDEILRD